MEDLARQSSSFRPITTPMTSNRVLAPFRGLPHIVTGFSAFLGVPRHASNDPHFITTTLEKLGTRHDCLLDLVEEVFVEDPFAALILLQVCGVPRFGHVISSVPPPLVTVPLLKRGTKRPRPLSRLFNMSLHQHILRTRSL